jgi:hypothetical protein
MLADIQKVEGLREDAMKERFSSMEKTLRDVHRGVQMIRDKQACFCTAFTFVETLRTLVPGPRS